VTLTITYAIFALAVGLIHGLGIDGSASGADALEVCVDIIDVYDEA
jgi:hypothetical protein